MKIENILATAITATSAVLDNLGVAFEYKKLADKRRDGARKACHRLRTKIEVFKTEFATTEGLRNELEAARQQRDDYLLILTTIAKGEEARELIKIRQLLGEFSRGVSVVDGVTKLMQLRAESVAEQDTKSNPCQAARENENKEQDK